jgi:CheY-like chemotaxis protein
VVLPLNPAAAAAAAPEPVATASVSGLPSLKVFVVEDHDDNREGMVALLRSLGCAVDAAADGREGVARIKDVRPDLAIVDVGLPGIDGYELARRVRQALGRSTLLVALTGYGRAEDREHALAAGFDLHLTKPVGADVLRAVRGQARAAQSRAAAAPAEPAAP